MLTEGMSGTISCQFDGNVLSYSWTLPNGIPMPSRMRAVRNVLEISRVSRGDGGIYLCVARGGSSGSVEARINVTVQQQCEYTDDCNL